MYEVLTYCILRRSCLASNVSSDGGNVHRLEYCADPSRAAADGVTQRFTDYPIRSSGFPVVASLHIQVDVVRDLETELEVLELPKDRR